MTGHMTSSNRQGSRPSNNLRTRLFAAVAAVCSIGLGTLAYAETPPTTAGTPVKQDAATMERLNDLAGAMRNVGHALEPSVVSIEVEKTGGNAGAPQLDEDMLRRFFPDRNGDGEPDLPRGFRMPNQDEDDAEGPQQRVRGEGSGVILDVEGNTAWILTNNHVAGDADKLTVTLSDGRQIENAEVVGTDPLTDLAVVKVEGENLQAAKWGDSEHLEKGDIVLAFGAPFGYVGSMTQGIVSAMNRQAGILGQNGYENFIQTDCAINPGNSGGPLVNVQGEVVGINTAIATRSGGFAGIGFAIPSQLAKHVYNQLKTDGQVTRGFIGVDIRDASAINRRQAERLGLEPNAKGIFVAGFRNDTPADGKLEPNDVITSIDGQPVKNTQELRFKISTTKPGTPVKLGLIRDRQPMEVELTVGQLPSTSDEAKGKTNAAERRDANRNLGNIGATLNDPNPARLREAGLPAGSKGALVTAVRPGSVAMMAGLEPGDLIKKVGEKAVNNANEAQTAMKQQDLKEGFDILIQNKEGTRSLFIQADGG